jgi:hypothetical protein
MLVGAPSETYSITRAATAAFLHSGSSRISKPRKFHWFMLTLQQAIAKR